jgi:hypothetical protein
MGADIHSQDNTNETVSDYKQCFAMLLSAVGEEFEPRGGNGRQIAQDVDYLPDNFYHDTYENFIRMKKNSAREKNASSATKETHLNSWQKASEDNRSSKHTLDDDASSQPNIKKTKI